MANKKYDREKIVHLYQRGATAAEIAQMTGATQHTVRRILREEGRGVGRTASEHAERHKVVHKMRKQGKTLREIAAVLGVTHQAIFERLAYISNGKPVGRPRKVRSAQKPSIDANAVLVDPGLTYRGAAMSGKGRKL